MNKMNKKPRKIPQGFHIRETKQEGSEIRNCLKCEKEFLSMHKFNKICPRCTLANSKY